MIDFKVFVDALVKGTPWAILIAGIGAIWQLVYVYSRDKIRDKQAVRQMALEEKKFEHQKLLESIKFEYEQRRWREQLGLQLALKHVDARLEEYAKAWSYIEAVATHRMDDGSLSAEVTKKVASNIKSWRYAKGGLLAEETTRDAAYALQRVLWEYSGTTEDYKRIRSARWLFREALRADTGLGEDMTGQTIFDATEKRQRICKELRALQNKLGISPNAESA